MTEHLELVKRAKSGDEEAFIRLMESQSDCMYKMAKTILKNEEDVADAMAETVLVCWEKLSTLKENRYVKTWMIRILMNKCYDLLRKKELLLTEDTVSEADAREDGYGMAEWEQVLQGLDEKYRLVMLLYYVDGFKIREVSEILDIPAATVKTRLVRGRKQLADEMKMEKGEDFMTEREKIEILQKKAEIPEVVRKKMQLAYGQIRQEKRMHEEIEGQKNERGKTVVSKKKVAIILAVATLSLATVSVAAGVYIRWSEGLKEKLQLTRTQEKELEEIGAAESTEASCTSQGITVTVLQSITDQNFSHLAFSVKGYSAETKEQPDFEQVIVKVDGKEVNASGSFRNFGEEDMPGYQKADGTMEYLMQIDSNEENGLAGKKIQVILENLGTVNKQAEFVSGVKGTWTLDWELAGTEKEEGLSVNQTIGDTDTVVKSIEITPLSLTIHYDMPRKKITKQSYGDDGVTTWETYEEPWFLYGFRMEDGTVRQMVFQSQEQGYDDETTEAYTVKYATDQIVEAEQINSLLYVKPGGNLQEPGEEDLVEVKLPK